MGRELGATLFCLISVGYHLELCIAITFYKEYQITWVVSMHTEEYEIT